MLPPGWVRVPLREGTRDAVEELVLARLRHIPPHIPRDHATAYRLAVRQALNAQVAAARAANGLDLYLPVQPRYRAALAASFLVSEVVLPGTMSPRAVLDALCAGRRRDLTDIAGFPAVRREYVRPAAPERDVPLASRHVDYALPVPRDPHRYLAVTFATAGNGDPDSEFTRAVVELFDALMTTFRWTLKAEVA
ncbi:hypothetical protein K7472_08495 [Streptomyces sp. PTM05]|uniref:Condensation domain-containing protein n=1 Tax=Streptantibioticus parmotrematis TaxID=2873249 RepID=A0ABS7QNX7_9ACTN|nr:hypothetical protein [Streptantibioticus parmotrematis]MBY8884886.1 hypothetical protein [Streptantibioticus parmotrematis]